MDPGRLHYTIDALESFTDFLVTRVITGL